MADPSPTAASSGVFLSFSAEAQTSLSSPRLTDRFPAFFSGIVGTTSASAMAEVIAAGLVRDLGACSAEVYLADPGGRMLQLHASHALHGAARAPDSVEIEAPLLVARAARGREVILSAAARGFPSCTCVPAWLPAGGPSGLFALPLLAGERLVGALSGELAGSLTPRDVESLTAMGVVVGAVLDRVQRVEQALARDEWVKVVAHEIRQPLNAMSFAASQLVVSETDTLQARSARTVMRSLRRVDRLVEDLLDTSLLDVADVALSPRPTDLVALACAAAEAMSNVHVEAYGDIPFVAIDPDRIQQVLDNLLVNARKYGTPATPIEVAVFGRENEVVVSVTNVGEEIPPHQREAIFDRYYRAHRGAAEGRGIGLYLCRALVAAHRGWIAVDCCCGLTVFSFGLPVTAAARR